MNIKYYYQKLWKKVSAQPLIRSSIISKKSAVWNDSIIINSTMGDYTYISDHTNIYYTSVGKYCSIASYCAVGGPSHPLNFVSTSPVFLSGRNALKKHFATIQYEPYKNTTIGNDVWIGANSCIKAGITIGDGAVVGMGSVVVKDVGPYEIWAGNPAHLIRKRFDDDTISFLLKTKWWDFSDEELRRFAEFFNDPCLFVQKYTQQVIGD